MAAGALQTCARLGSFDKEKTPNDEAAAAESQSSHSLRSLAGSNYMRISHVAVVAPADQHDPLRQLIRLEELGARDDVLLARHAETDRYRSGGDQHEAAIERLTGDLDRAGPQKRARPW
jgi:hypothetical protein